MLIRPKMKSTIKRSSFTFGEGLVGKDGYVIRITFKSCHDRKPEDIFAIHSQSAYQPLFHFSVQYRYQTAEFHVILEKIIIKVSHFISKLRDHHITLSFSLSGLTWFLSIFVSFFIFLSHYPGNSAAAEITNWGIRKYFSERKKIVFLQSSPTLFHVQLSSRKI